VADLNLEWHIKETNVLDKCLPKEKKGKERESERRTGVEWLFGENES
jgi:hypothetical protein